MKYYDLFSDYEQKQQRRRECDRLRLFQYMLRNHPELNEQYHGKALEIADGLQPWIDALELDLN